MTYPVPVWPTRIISASSSRAACMSASAGSASAATSVAAIPRSCSSVRLRSSSFASLIGWRSVENRLRDDALRSEARPRRHDDHAAAAADKRCRAFERTLRRRRAVVADDDGPRTEPRSCVVRAVDGIPGPCRRRVAGRERPFARLVDCRAAGPGCARAALSSTGWSGRVMASSVTGGGDQRSGGESTPTRTVPRGDDDDGVSRGVHQHADGSPTPGRRRCRRRRSARAPARQLKGPVMTGRELHNPSEPMFGARCIRALREGASALAQPAERPAIPRRAAARPQRARARSSEPAGTGRAADDQEHVVILRVSAKRLRCLTIGP